MMTKLLDSLKTPNGFCKYHCWKNIWKWSV